jgi:hypothetical protein
MVCFSILKMIQLRLLELLGERMFSDAEVQELRFLLDA